MACGAWDDCYDAPGTVSTRNVTGIYGPVYGLHAIYRVGDNSLQK